MVRLIYEEAENFFAYLEMLQFEYIQIRMIGGLRSKRKNVISKSFKTSKTGFQSFKDWVTNEKFECEHLHCTFNEFALPLGNDKKAISDRDVTTVRHFFVDIDPLRDTGTNATKEEKGKAFEMANKIKGFLKAFEIIPSLVIDSGNGYHLYFLLESHKKRELHKINKEFLAALDSRFSNEDVHVDTSVANPGRVGKLPGSVSCKGEHSEERPQRNAKIIEIQNDPIPISVRVFQEVINELENKASSDLVNHKKRNPTKQRDVLPSKITRTFDVEKWQHYHDLSINWKDGDEPNIKIGVFDTCPLRKHTNNPNGAYLTMYGMNKCSFNCMHHSDSDKTVDDLLEQYPIPDTAKLEMSSSEIITIEGLEKGYSYIFENYELSKNGLWQREKNNPSVKISNPLFVEEIYRTIESNEIRLTLCHLANNEWLRLTVDGGLLQTNVFKQLARNGLVFKARSESNVIDFLHLQKEKLAVALEHKVIGWVEEEGELIYQAASSHAKSLNHRSSLSPSSTYDLGDFGEANRFEELINNDILGSELELGVAIGLSPLPLGYFNKSRRKVMNNLIINLQGISSTGKTAALMLIASLYGNPNTIVRNFNATNNAIIKLATDNHGGVPLIFDELGAANVKDLSSLFFQLASGEERLRMDVNRELVKQQKFEVVVLMSSEEHVEFYLQKDIDGLKVRHLEFSDIKWTKSAEHAEKIKTTIQNNYGHVVKHLIDNLIEVDVDSLKKWFDESKSALLPQMKEHDLKNRIAENIALVRTGALMAIHLLDWKLNLDRIDGHLLQSYENLIDKSSLNKKSIFEKVKELLVLNANKFIVANSNETRKFSPIWGKVSTTKAGELKVNIISHAFEELLRKEFQVRDVTYIIKKLLSEGKMQAEVGRNTKRVRINKQSITTYEILLPADLKQYFAINTQENQGPLLGSPLLNATLVEDDDLKFD